MLIRGWAPLKQQAIECGLTFKFMDIGLPGWGSESLVNSTST